VNDSGFINKVILLRYTKHPDRVSYLLRNCRKYVPCRIKRYRKKFNHEQEIPVGFSIIEIKPLSDLKMSFAIPDKYIMTTHPFLRVSYPLSLESEVLKLVLEIRNYSKENNKIMD